MFKRDPDAGLDRVETVIGRGATVNGSLNGTGTLRVDGKVEGQVMHRGDVVVGETGLIEATIQARNITVAGEIRGSVEAEGKLELIATGKLTGDVKVAALIINEGAFFHGSCAMRSAESPGKAPRKPADGGA
ncbi:MAG TPA: polymer-forming cytoskeletal protein [Bacillota bacterium]|nr:polymer-forming cytoskeletal protein [Bacillota bacterium]